MTKQKETIDQDEAWDINALFSPNNSIENAEEDSLEIAILFNFNGDTQVNKFLMIKSHNTAAPMKMKSEENYMEKKNSKHKTRWFYTNNRRLHATQQSN